MQKNDSTSHIKPFIKWAGGKEKELNILKNFYPKKFSKYIEPFVGGGAVFLNTDAQTYYINDKSSELIALYSSIKTQSSAFFSYLTVIAKSWKYIEEFSEKNKASLIKLFALNNRNSLEEYIKIHFVELKENLCISTLHSAVLENELKRNLFSKINRANKIQNIKGTLPEEEIFYNMECALKSSYYMYLRSIYNKLDLNDNPNIYSAVFYFIREYCYSSMFRYNKNGTFNVPYGGISYNRKDFSNKINLLKNPFLISKLEKASIYNEDFESFLNNLIINNNDFIFLDPPYDTEFSTYAKNPFDKEDQIRLCEYLKNTKAQFLLVIKETDFIKNLYKDFNIASFDKHYLVSFKNRNKKDVKHLIITNYEVN
ncbi:DNA adenine methylase [Treponema sp. C6A8]|uniref:DNA adenine methylase n=1 Tax=Treponema sp. C6A8 TaxID=1410609 RepID=UPI0006883A51|nr:DNA adenine methylase [Treponema sp. C6A8]